MERNMYGCLPCPECGSKYRWPQKIPGDPNKRCRVRCDDCGLQRPVSWEEPEESWHYNAEGE